MSKPREFWICVDNKTLMDNRNHSCYDQEQFDFHSYNGNFDFGREKPLDLIRVIEKSAYDKAIKALKFYSEFGDYGIGTCYGCYKTEIHNDEGELATKTLKELVELTPPKPSDDKTGDKPGD